MKTLQYFSNNWWHDPASREWFGNINPAIATICARIPCCNARDINRAVSSAHSAFESWQALLPSAHSNLGRKLGDVFVRNADRLGEVEIRDNGKELKVFLQTKSVWPETQLSPPKPVA